MTEQELAQRVVEYFQLALPGWRIHHEVDCGAVADLVVTDGRLIHVVEVKRAQSLALIEQLMGWRGHAHLISAAVPVTRRSSRGSEAFHWAARQLGCGVFELGASCRQVVLPTFTRRISNRVRKRLCDEQTRPEEWAYAGSAHGGHFTPFQRTTRAVADYARNHPGCSMREIVQHVAHHYASDAGARASLTKWIVGGMIRGVRIEDGKVFSEGA